MVIREKPAEGQEQEETRTLVEAGSVTEDPA